MNKNDFINKFSYVKRVEDAYTNDGEKLGKITALDDDYLTIKEGMFFPKEFSFRYDEIMDIRDDNVILKYNKADLKNWNDKNYEGWNEYDKTYGKNVPESKYTSDTRIPLSEEELETQKMARQRGEVRVRKVVHTELKSFTVPVTREEVIVERVPADQIKGKTDETAFKEGETVIPVMEEDVELVKKQKNKGEVRIHKETTTEQKKVSGNVRKEDVEVKRDDEDRRKAA